MKTLLKIICLIALFNLARIDAAEEIILLPGLGHLHHPVSTQNQLAQQYFDQGLTLVYAFNHDAAYQSFKKAAEIDPELAMAYWGMALSLGQNINMDITKENELLAYDLIQKAVGLSNQITPNEQAYINALSTRYTNVEHPDFIQLRHNYKNAMEQVVQQFPEDLDAATLYAESGMDLKPWRLWSYDNKPEEGTLEVVNVLESVLKRNPEHLGANHYYIHAIEGSAHPEYALMSAYRLESLLPASGHILHMPAHIFILVGDYEQAAKSNEAAIKADWDYIRQFGISGSYAVHYLSHNYFFLSRAYELMGRFEDSLKAANDLQKLYLPHANAMPELEYYALNPFQVLLRFHRWNDILNSAKPSPELKSAIGFWHYARALAYANLNQRAMAEQERQLFDRARHDLSLDAKLGSNSAQTIFEIANDLLEAKFAKMDNNPDKVIDLLEKAIALQDHLYYNEPPDWFYSIRETLGAELLLLNHPKQAQEVFKQDLDKHPRNPRSLYGLWLSWKAQNDEADAFWVEQELKKAWQHSTTHLSLKDLAL